MQLFCKIVINPDLSPLESKLAYEARQQRWQRKQQSQNNNVVETKIGTDDHVRSTLMSMDNSEPSEESTSTEEKLEKNELRDGDTSVHSMLSMTQDASWSK